MFDGSEAADPEFEVPDINRIVMSVSVEIFVLARNARETSIELNRLRAIVCRALALKPSLDGIAVGLRYIGCDEPEPLDLKLGLSDGKMRLSFEVSRLEPSQDPYSPE